MDMCMLFNSMGNFLQMFLCLHTQGFYIPKPAKCNKFNCSQPHFAFMLLTFLQSKFQIGYLIKICISILYKKYATFLFIS